MVEIEHIINEPSSDTCMIRVCLSDTAMTHIEPLSELYGLNYEQIMGLIAYDLYGDVADSDASYDAGDFDGSLFYEEYGEKIVECRKKYKGRKYNKMIFNEDEGHWFKLKLSKSILIDMEFKSDFVGLPKEEIFRIQIEMYLENLQEEIYDFVYDKEELIAKIRRNEA